MFKNYLKVAFRNIVRHKGYSFINITGLAVGMACCIMIMLWVQNELNYDGFNKKADNIYRVYHDMKMGDTRRIAPLIGPPAALALIQDFPEVVNAVRLTPERSMDVGYQEKHYNEDLVRYADNSFFDIFSFPLLRANAFLRLDPGDSDKLRFAGDAYAGVSDRLLAMLTRHLGDEEDLIVPIILERGESDLGL